ncbi:MAG TPA: transposase, partial [Phycisphaerales bacterium]|nr:transposase [Phycisphaerales bacterium]
RRAPESAQHAPLFCYAQSGFNTPLAYFISFRTYGTWLHGDARGSVDRTQNRFGAPKVWPRQGLVKFEQRQLNDAPLVLDEHQRVLVDQAIRGVCTHKAWKLHAINIRTNHVHVVVTAKGPPEPVMTALKAWGTRRLREEGLIGRERRVWSRHGSTIYLFREENLAEKVRYVLEGQDEA